MKTASLIIDVGKLLVQYNLDHPNTLVIRMRNSVRISEFVQITEINIKLIRDDFHLILQKGIQSGSVIMNPLNKNNRLS